MDISIWNEFCRYQWNLSRLYHLLDKYNLCKSLMVPINLQIKIITMGLLISKWIYIPAELWIIIQYMSKHMKKYKPKTIFLHHSIDFQCSNLFDRNYESTYSTNMGRLGSFGDGNDYMICNTDNKNKIIHCVNIIIFIQRYEYNSYYTITIKPDSLTKVYTFDEFYCSTNTLYEVEYDFPESLTNKMIFNKSDRIFINEVSFEFNEEYSYDEHFTPNTIRVTPHPKYLYCMIIEVDNINEIISYVELDLDLISNMMIINECDAIKWCTFNEFEHIYCDTYAGIYDVIDEQNLTIF